jgi:prepilin-type processing-associated H-X9-DG protein/prepilin-type N-terminal cleavage/methylation domain-containing protein
MLNIDSDMLGGCRKRHFVAVKFTPQSVLSKGFTLVELLVVISIIGLLAGLAIPAVKGGLDAGKAAKCANNLKQMGIGFQRYAAENNGYLPQAWGNSGYDGWPGWDVLILDYLEVGAKGSGGNRVYSENMATPLLCPSDTCRTNIFYNMGPFGNLRYSYRINISSSDSVPGALPPPIKIAQLPSPSKSILVCDGEFKYTHHVSTRPSHANSTQLISRGNSNNVATTRHSGAANYLFADGHVEKLKWAETWDRTVPGADPSWGLWQQR